MRGEAQPDAPYGPGPKAALEDALELGRKLGFKVGQADNRIGWVEYGEGKEMVGVLGHVDVVPAGDTGWDLSCLWCRDPRWNSLGKRMSG